jgi:hypothetical protein
MREQPLLPLLHQSLTQRGKTVCGRPAPSPIFASQAIVRKGGADRELHDRRQSHPAFVSGAKRGAARSSYGLRTSTPGSPEKSTKPSRSLGRTHPKASKRRAAGWPPRSLPRRYDPRFCPNLWLDSAIVPPLCIRVMQFSNNTRQFSPLERKIH